MQRGCWIFTLMRSNLLVLLRLQKLMVEGLKWLVVKTDSRAEACRWGV